MFEDWRPSHRHCRGCFLVPVPRSLAFSSMAWHLVRASFHVALNFPNPVSVPIPKRIPNPTSAPHCTLPSEQLPPHHRHRLNGTQTPHLLHPFHPLKTIHHLLLLLHDGHNIHSKPPTLQNHSRIIIIIHAIKQQQPANHPPAAVDQLPATNAAARQVDRRLHGVFGRGGRVAVCVLCAGGELCELFPPSPAFFVLPDDWVWVWV